MTQRVLVLGATGQLGSDVVDAFTEAGWDTTGLGHADLDVVDSFTGLLVDYARTHKAQVVLRGLRAISDFEFEFQMTHMNRRLHPGLEMVFMMTDEEYFFVSSGLVREIASFGGKVQGLVPPSVEKKLAERSR